MDALYKSDKTAKDFDDLLAQHKNLVYYMLKQTGQLTNQDAESAAWEALWDSIGTFDIYGNVPFSSYACVVIRNAINDVMRKQLLHAAKEQIVVDVLTDCGATCTPACDSILDNNRVYELFNEYIKDKSGSTRNVLLLWQGSSFDCTATYIAKASGCSVSYVCRIQQLFRAYLSSHLC